VVQELSATGIVPATIKMYRTGVRHLTTFCDQVGLLAYLASERVLMLFAAHLYTQNVAHGTIKSYMVAMHYDQIFRDWGSKDSPDAITGIPAKKDQKVGTSKFNDKAANYPTGIE